VRPPDLSGIRARVLLIRGRYDRMVPVEVSIAILNHIADSRLVLLNGKRTAIAEGAGNVVRSKLFGLNRRASLRPYLCGGAPSNGRPYRNRQ
jgi:hypothetical protein